MARRTFFYNTAVTRVNTTMITNVYVNKTIIVNNTSHVAFNGGRGGVDARPTARQLAYAHQTHTPPIAAQNQQREAASKNRALFASNNHGRPPIAASAKPGEFSGKGVIAARAAGGTYHAPECRQKKHAHRDRPEIMEKLQRERRQRRRRGPRRSQLKNERLNEARLRKARLRKEKKKLQAVLLPSPRAMRSVAQTAML